MPEIPENGNPGRLKSRRMKRLGDFVEILAVTLLVSLLIKTFVLDAVCVPSESMKSTLMSGDYVFVNKLIYGARAPKYLPFTHSEFPFFRMPGFGDISRGDVIVFEFPENESGVSSGSPVYFVKRCVALRGDTLAIRDGRIIVNGKPMFFGGEVKGYKTTPWRGIADYGPVIIPRKGVMIELAPGNYAQWESLIRREGHSIAIASDSLIIIDGVPAKSYKTEKNYVFAVGDNIDHSYDSRSWGFLPEENVVGKATLIYWSVNPSRTQGGHRGFLGSVRWDRIGKFIN